MLGVYRILIVVYKTQTTYYRWRTTTKGTP